MPIFLRKIFFFIELIASPYSIASPKPILGGTQNKIFFFKIVTFILFSNLIKIDYWFHFV